MGNSRDLRLTQSLAWKTQISSFTFEILSKENCQPKVLPTAYKNLYSRNLQILQSCYLLLFCPPNSWASREAREHQTWVGWGTGWGKIVRFNHTCISKEQHSKEPPKWVRPHGTAVFLRWSCLSLEPDLCLSLPCAAFCSYMAMLVYKAACITPTPPYHQFVSKIPITQVLVFTHACEHG